MFRTGLHRQLTHGAFLGLKLPDCRYLVGIGQRRFLVGSSHAEDKRVVWTPPSCTSRSIQMQRFRISQMVAKIGSALKQPCVYRRHKSFISSNRMWLDVIMVELPVLCPLKPNQLLAAKRLLSSARTTMIRCPCSTRLAYDEYGTSNGVQYRVQLTVIRVLSTLA